MKKVRMMYLKKRLDAIIVGVLLVTGFAFYQNRIVNPMYQAIIERQNFLIEKVTGIPRYSIQNDFGKTKAKEGSVNLNLNNTLDVKNKEATQINNDTVKKVSDKKKSFWDKIFGQKD